jgi:hypothetical protein
MPHVVDGAGACPRVLPPLCRRRRQRYVHESNFHERRSVYVAHNSAFSCENRDVSTTVYTRGEGMGAVEPIRSTTISVGVTGLRFTCNQTRANWLFVRYRLGLTS